MVCLDSGRCHIALLSVRIAVSVDSGGCHVVLLSVNMTGCVDSGRCHAILLSVKMAVSSYFVVSEHGGVWREW